MGITRKLLSVSTAGLVAFHSDKERTALSSARTARASRQTAAEARRQSALLRAPKLESRLLDLRQAAAYLATSDKQVRELVSAGEIPVTRVGRVLRFDRLELDRWIESNTS